MVVNPGGEIVASLGQEEEILLVSIDLEQIRLAREAICYLNDRDPGL
jgi:predicted amidohydrolase